MDNDHWPESAWAIEAARPVDLDGWTLEESLVWLSRETGRAVTFADPESRARLGAERIEGELPLAPTEAMQIVPRLFGLTSEDPSEEGSLTTAGAPRSTKKRIP